MSIIGDEYEYCKECDAYFGRKHICIKDDWTLDITATVPCEDDPIESGENDLEDCTPCEAPKCKCGKTVTVFLMGKDDTLCLCQECAYPNQPKGEFQSTSNIRWMIAKKD